MKDYQNPILYYDIREDVERDRLFVVEETEFVPEYVACHPDDLDKVKTWWAFLNGEGGKLIPVTFILKAMAIMKT